MAPLHDACRDGDTEQVRRLLNGAGLPVDEKDKDDSAALMIASFHGHRRWPLLLDKDAAVNKKDKDGYTGLMYASEKGHTEVVQLLLGEGAALDEKGKWGSTALLKASRAGRTKVVQLLLDKGAAVDEKNNAGSTALMKASREGHTEVVQLLLGKGAEVNETDEKGSTALMWASGHGQTEVVQLLLGEGAAIDEKRKDNGTALMYAGWNGHTEVTQLLVEKGAVIDVKNKDGDTAVPAFANFDEEQLGRMAATVVHCQLLKGKGPGSDAALDATATAVLQLVRLAGHARERALKLRSSDPHSADDHQVLFGRLQLAAAACIQKDVSGKARDENKQRYDEKEVHKLLCSEDGLTALEHAVQIEAKELLAQPVVQDYMMVAWRGPHLDFSDAGWLWGPCIVVSLLVVLLQLVIFLPLVAIVPDLEPKLAGILDQIVADCTRKLPWLAGELGGYYLLRLPVVKFGLESAADLAHALALTLVPATDLATAPIAPLLLAWVGSGLLREARQVMAFSISSSDDLHLAATWLCISRLERVHDCLTAYWADSINRLDAMALIFSFAALVVFMSTDSENATATSLRAVAVFLLWLRVIRVLLISPKFGPFVMMFFRMLFGDVFYFMVLLFFVLVAFAASWTVLLEPEPALLAQQSGDDQNWKWMRSHAAHLETAGCADELGGLDFFSTLRTLFEGALTGNDFFECARDSTSSPLAAWVISTAFVTLTSVLLLNMLIAMMAKTFDNISEASATNYLFLFTQRTLALQNEPPTPPPLNALGLPCKAVYLLWKKQKRPIEPEASNAAAADATDGKTAGQGDEEEETAPGAKEEETAPLAERIAPLAEKITEYINAHQDDAAQEDRWRTTMKRETMRRFREQREAIDKLETAMRKLETAMLTKMDEKMEQLIKSIRSSALVVT